MSLATARRIITIRMPKPLRQRFIMSHGRALNLTVILLVVQRASIPEKKHITTMASGASGRMMTFEGKGVFLLARG